MIYINAFILGGFICLIGELILDNTKLTPGHITSIFTVLGAFLSFLGVYPKLIEWGGAGATMMISNFGNLLYQGAYEGFHESEILGFASGLLTKASAAITMAIVFAFIFSIFFKPKD